MRLVCFAAAVLTLTVPTSAGTQQRDKAAHLNGKWHCLRIESINGSQAANFYLKIEGTKASWSAPNQTALTATGSATIDPDANPPRMDITPEYGIYRLDADTLVLCLWPNAKDRQTTFDLSKQNPPGRVLTYRRVKE